MPPDPINYILCSNPRSGTTLLCSMLAQTGVAGKPDSFFRQKSLQDWSDAWGIAGPVDPCGAAFNTAFFAALRREGRGSTARFGMRLMGPDLEYAMAWLKRLHPDAGSDKSRIDAAFGPTCFIHLSRQDKLAEAVSYVRAEQSGLWHQNADGSDLERIAPTGTRGFDAGTLKKQMEELCTLDQQWHHWFAREGITPLSLSYEALAANPNAVLAQVLAFIGSDPRLADDVSPRLRKLADETSEDWIRRFRALYPNAMTAG